MKTKLLVFLTSVILVTMVSCSDDDQKRAILHDGNGFTLTYSLSETESVLTRSSIDVEEGEDILSSFYILFFEKTSGGTGSFLEAIDVMGPHSVPFLSSGNVEIEFPATSRLKNSETYNMLICANIDDYTVIDGIEELISFCEGKTENQVATLLLQTIEGVEPGDGEEADNTMRMSSFNLPMGVKLVKEANVSQVTVELTRTVGRFDVFCEANGYELYSASVWNAYTNGFVWEGNFTDYTSPRTERYYGVGVNSQKEIIGSLYAFENYVAEPVQNDKVTTCLIIGLKNLETGDIEYFRTNINASRSYGQQIQRNHAYRIIVKNVFNAGDDNERGAYENSNLLLDIDVKGWMVDDSGTIQVVGGNVLAMPTTTARLFTQGETREYFVYTIGQGVPEITGEYLPGQIKASLKLAPGYSEKSNFKKSILTLNAGPGTTKDSNETYQIDFTFAGMDASITVEQTEGNQDFLYLSSSEMVKLAAELGSPSENITVSSSGAWVAEILKKDTFFSFASGSALYTVQGNSGDSFKVYTQKRNTTVTPRYWFVRVYLKDNPLISQTLVIAQAGTGGLRYVAEGESFLQ